MTGPMKWTGTRRQGWRVAVAAITLAPATVALMPSSVAGAKTTTNTFVVKGAYSGTLTLTPSSDDCLFSKSYDGKSYLATLSHMKGTIKGVGAGPWAMTLHVAKMGTTHVAKVDVHSYTNSSMQNNSAPLTQFIVTGGTEVDNGATGSVTVTVVHHIIGTLVYKGVATITGSWNCPQGLNNG